MAYGIYLVDGESGGVGKSTFSRLLVEFFVEKKYKFELYDLDTTKSDVGPVYHEHVPNVQVEGQVEGQPQQSEQPKLEIRFSDNKRMSSKVDVLFDRADKNNVIGNLPSNCKINLDSWIKDNGLLNLAQSENIAFVKFFVTSGQKTSLDLFSQTVKQYRHKSGILHVLCYNEVFEIPWEEIKSKNTEVKNLIEADGIPVIQIPQLNGNYYDFILDRGLSFKSAMDKGENSLGIIGRQAVSEFRNASFERLSGLTATLGLEPNKVTPKDFWHSKTPGH